MIPLTLLLVGPRGIALLWALGMVGGYLVSGAADATLLVLQG